MPDKDKKLPALQWYPGDWRKDLAVQSLSFHDRGVWFEMLMLMHDSEQRGMLVLNGRAMSDEMVARAIGLDNQIFNQTLTTLLTIGVAEREPNTGAICNRRMIRDEHIRKIRAEAGSKGGNPVLLNQKPTTGVKQNPTPSSSSSTSFTKEELTTKEKESLFATPPQQDRRTDTKATSGGATPKAIDALNVQLPTWIDAAAWEGFVLMRKFTKKPITTQRAANGIISKLGRLRASGQDPNACLDQSTENSYQGVFAVNDGGRNGNQGNRTNYQHRSKTSGNFDEARAALSLLAGEELDGSGDGTAGECVEGHFTAVRE